MTAAACPACDSAALLPFYAVDGVPVNSCLLLDDETVAREFPRGDLRIAACDACGFVTNTAFDPAVTTYSADYEETQGFSLRFREYIADLVDEWVGRYDLVGGTVVEIGCGKGEFLTTMIRAGIGHGIGIDPGLHLDRIDADVRDRTTWVSGLFPDDFPTLDADAVVCRHTLEHLAPVGRWLRAVRAAIGDRTDTVLLFELPDALRVLREGAFWDVYYEHCSYFSVGSLDGLFRRAGFEPLDLRRTYDDQYLVIEARPATPSTPAADDRTEVLDATRSFANAQAEMAAHWRRRVQKVAESGGSTVLWGASSKAVAFLAALGDDASHVEAAVDINPYKQGRFLPGSGHRVVAPQELPEISPDLVVVMNPTYVAEIGRDLDALRIATALEPL